MPPHPVPSADKTRKGPATAVSVVTEPGPVAPPAPVATLRQRKQFLRAAQARRVGMPGFLLQARRRDADEPAEAAIRIGFTCSKKIGNAVTRNRAKRRLRALARAIMPVAARPGWDYVLVGRPGVTVSADFSQMQRDLETALARIHAPHERHPQ